MPDTSRKQVSIPRLFITAIFVVGLVLLAYKLLENKEQNAANQAVEENIQASAAIAGVDRVATSNALDSRFKDANKDMLADVPSDAKEYVDPAVIKFSYLTSDNPEKYDGAFKELMDAISKATGKSVEYVEYASPEDRHIAFHRGDVHLVGLNTGLVPVAVCTSGFQPIAMMADTSGNATYKLAILTNNASPVKQLSDIKGREFTFTEMNSNSGYKAPFTILAEAGLKFSYGYDPRFSQSYKQSLEGLKSGTYETIAIADDVLRREASAGTIAENQFRTIYTSTNNFPTAALGYRNDLSPVLAAKIKQAILDFKWEGTGLAKIYGSEGRAKFVPIDYAKDWEYVRKIDENMGVKYLSPTGEPALYQPPAPATQPTTQPEN